MSKDRVMSRLRDANPDRVADIRNEQLRDLIVSHTPTWRSSDRADERALRRGWVPKISRFGALGAGIAASGIAAAALAVALTVSLSGSAPNVAQAFPALNGPSVLTPAALALSLRNYGVGGDGGIDIAKGHVVGTPWGNGDVLTGPGDSFVCVVAPGLEQRGLGRELRSNEAGNRERHVVEGVRIRFSNTYCSSPAASPAGGDGNDADQRRTGPPAQLVGRNLGHQHHFADTDRRHDQWSHDR